MSRRPRLAVLLSELHPLLDGADLAAVVDLATAAEAAGVDAAFLGEHVVLGEGSDAEGEPADSFEPLRPGRIPPSTPWLEPLVTLGAIAGATRHIGLGTAILIAPLRPPVLLAKQLATLDVVSRGRLEVGLGVSWHEAEYRALGAPFGRRGARLDETLAILHALWSGSPVRASGDGFELDDIWLEPKPVRPIPLWFGGAYSARMSSRVVRYGAGLAPLPRLEPHQFVELIEDLAAAGRDVGNIDFITGLRPVRSTSRSGGPADLATSMAEVPQLMAAGYTTFVLWPNVFTDSADELGAVMGEAATTFAALAAP